MAVQRAWLCGFALGFIFSTPSFATTCPDLDVAGSWENGHGQPFDIEQPNCERVVIHDVNHHARYEIKLDGKTVTAISGERLDNGPGMIRFNDKGGVYSDRTTRFVQDLALTGKLVTNPFRDPKYPLNSAVKNAEIRVTAKLAFPLRNKSWKFYPLTGSVVATVTTFRVSTDPSKPSDEIWIHLSNPRIEDIGDTGYTSGSSVKKGFLLALNTILGLFDPDSRSHYDPVTQSGTYISGAYDFHLVDYPSLSLHHRVPSVRRTRGGEN